MIKSAKVKDSFGLLYPMIILPLDFYERIPENDECQYKKVINQYLLSNLMNLEKGIAKKGGGNRGCAKVSE